MSDLFRLNGQLQTAKLKMGPVKKQLCHRESMRVDHLSNLANDLYRVAGDFEGVSLIDGVVVSLRYVDVVSKSRRVSFLLNYPKHPSDSSIVGSRIEQRNGRLAHVMTYYVTRDAMINAAEQLHAAAELFSDYGVIQSDRLEEIASKEYVTRTGLRGNKLVQLLVDASNVVEAFRPIPKEEQEEYSLVTAFSVGKDFSTLLRELDIPFNPGEVVDDFSIVLSKQSYRLLCEKAGFLIAQTNDITQLVRDTAGSPVEGDISIPSPQSEPFIGVLDGFFDKDVYFGEWVDSSDDYMPDGCFGIEDRAHGTEVCSIIVNGPARNPDLDDRCGHFRVKHFTIAHKGKNSWINIKDRIEKIVTDHPEIRVWNLSFGSEIEVDPNYISPVAYLLDKLQKERDILFVVAGTNVPEGREGDKMFIGAPADSVNSLVVNACTFDGSVPVYGRHGPVLSFFRKPDLAYFGGDGNGFNDIAVDISSTYAEKRSGTSLAAPWITRKAAFLMEVMGFSVEETKALLIDSTFSSGFKNQNPDYLGYGIVPIDIHDVIESRTNEIRFLIKGQCDSYYTYSYNLPVPIFDGTFPFKSRIVMSTMLSCDRNKGVDYTNEEIGVSFGRMKDGKIKPINNDGQDDEGSFVGEELSRAAFRKWDNVKVIAEPPSTRRVGQKVYSNDGLWGIRVSSKVRNDKYKKAEKKTKFAMVVTLREIYGQDRSAEFEQLCWSRGWIVERINVETKVKAYVMATSDIVWN